MRRRYQVTVLGVWRGVPPENVSRTRPVELVGPEYRITAEDTLLLAGEESAVDALTGGVEESEAPLLASA